MKTFCLAAVSLWFVLHASIASAQGTLDELKGYLAQRDEIKTLELPALKAIASDAKEKNSRRGLAEYYIFLKSPRPNGDAAAGAKQLDALLKASDVYLDPLTFVKMAILYSNDYPDYGSKRDPTKCLLNLSISWELADVSDKATGDNALLTLIINNTLGLGDGIFGYATSRDRLKKTLDAIRPDVLKARARFKKLYGLTMKDEASDMTNVERHYGR